MEMLLQTNPQFPLFLYMPTTMCTQLWHAWKRNACIIHLHDAALRKLIMDTLKPKAHELVMKVIETLTNEKTSQKTVLRKVTTSALRTSVLNRCR
eukprot:6218747-Amphidinium_carterae.2